MVVAISISPPTKGRTPKLSMLELVTVVNSRYRKSKLRKRISIIPQGFCYVCSRIDPGGIFRNQNSYLFQRGFFHACEHFQQAPQSTFVGDEIKIDLDRKETSTVTETVAPSISVTIKHEPDSGRFVTPPRREKSILSKSREPGRTESVKGTPSVKYSSGTNRFPPISTSNRTDLISEAKTRSATKSPTKTEPSLRARTLSSIELRSPGNRSKRSALTKTVSSAKDDETLSNYGTDRVTVIPTALDDDVTKSDEKSSDITPTSRAIESQTTTTLKDAFTTTAGQATTDKVGRSTNVGGATTEETNEITSYINRSDGLGSIFSVEPLIREVVLLEDSRHGNIPHRQAGARGREKHHGAEIDTAADRPESGHLRYHHRNEEDSVPDPGFEIPPTPSVEERLQLERLEREEKIRKEAEREAIEREIAKGNVFVEASVDGDLLESISDDASLGMTDARSARSSRHRVRPTLSSSSRQSFCRCPSETRESSFMKSTCLICGKGILYGNARRSRESSISQNEAVAPSMRSPGTVSNISRQQMLYNSKQHQQQQQLQQQQQQQSRVKSKGKSVSDEDYMDLESIIHEDDGRYWSSDEDEYETQYMTRSAMLRYRNARPFPLVDPNLHKLVYIKALHEAQLRSAMEGEEDFDTLDRLRHPLAFSYFPLLPGLKKGNVEQSYIGLRAPEDTIKIKEGHYMRHIFGDVDVDQFYPKSSRKVRKHSLLDITDTALVSSDRVSTERTRTSPRTMADIPRDDERTSVSLKMRKSGVNFENGP